MRPITREVGIIEAKLGDGDLCTISALEDIKEIYIPKSRIKMQF